MFYLTVIFKTKFLVQVQHYQTKTLFKRLYPLSLINKVVKEYLDHKFSTDQNQFNDILDVHYFKLPCIYHLQNFAPYFK